MKPNPEQDADRAAFEKWVALNCKNQTIFRDGLGEYCDHTTYGDWVVWQAAKADIRAMQDAFEQVCAEAEKVQQWQSDDGIAPYYDLAKALTLAAPFR